MQTRDIVVIGSSMGGIEALSTLVRQLPASLLAAVCVVQHLSEESPGMLSEILARRASIDVATAEDGMDLVHGRVLVAPPNRHLLLDERAARVVFGPRENRSRPAIDPLFRTAAVHHRGRVIGVVLTGLLGDGAAGLHAVVRCGGVAIVQAPRDAAFPEMPSRALGRVPEAHAIRLAEIGPMLERLVCEPAPDDPEVPAGLRMEARFTERAMAHDDWHELPSRPTSFTCPECSGALHAMDEGGAPRFRCRVGHAFTGDELLGAKTRSLEDSLWVALQTLEERAKMLTDLALEDGRRGRGARTGGFGDRAREAREHAERLRELLEALAA